MINDLRHHKIGNGEFPPKNKQGRIIKHDPSKKNNLPANAVIFVLLPESLACFYACTFGPQFNGCLQSSVSIQSSSLWTPESITPSAVRTQFPEYIIQK